MGIQRQKRADDVHAQIAVFHQQPSAPESRFRRPRHRVGSTYDRGGCNSIRSASRVTS